MKMRRSLQEKEPGIAAPPRISDVFLGRALELETLARHIDACLRRAGGVVLVTGEPGIGKTRLAEQAVAHAKAKGVRALWGRCWEGDGAPAFWPWIQIVRSLARELEVDSWPAIPDGDARDMARVIPELRQLLPQMDLERIPADTDQTRFRFFESFSAFLKRVATTRPIMLVLDDLHWADQGSLLLLQYLSTAIADAAVLLLATSRDYNPRPDHCLSQLIAGIGRQRHTSRLALLGLGEDEVREFLRSAIGADPPTPLVTTIMKRTEGNPFFLREIMELLGPPNASPLSNENTIHFSLPLTIREVLSRHLNSLSGNCINTLRVASVLGRDFDAEVVAESLGKATHIVCQILDEAIGARIVEPIRTTHYRFEHALVRETIYASLPHTVRAQLHSSITSALERLGTSGQSLLPSLAYHSFMSLPYGVPGQAFDYAVRAGTDARSRLAYEEAVGHYERALELGGSRLAAPSHCELLLLLGEAQARAGRWLVSRHTYERAATEARLIGSARHFARAAIGFKGMMGATIPVDDSAVALLREAMQRLSDTEGDLQVHILSALTYSLYFARAEDKMEQYSRRAIEMAQRANDDGLKRTALEARLISLFRPSHLKDRLLTAQALLDLSSGVEDREFAFRARLMRHICMLEMGDPLASTVELELAARLAVETRHPRCQWQMTLANSSRALASGDLRGSEELTELAREVGERVHDSSSTHYFLIQRFQYQRVVGTYDGWEEMIAAAVARFPEVVGYRAAQALTYSTTGETRKARGILSLIAAGQFRDIGCDAVSLWTLGMLAEVCVKCGEVEWCECLYTLLLPYQQQNVVVSWGIAFDGSVSHFLGLLSAAFGQCEAADGHFEAALEMNARMGAEPLLARTQLRFAEILLGRRREADQQRAFRLLSDAIAAMSRFGQVGHLADAQALVARMHRACPLTVLRKHTGEASADVLAPAGGDISRAGASGGDDYVFRREADFWTIAFEGKVVRLRHTRGLAMLALLLKRPQTDLHVIDMVGAIDGVRPLDPDGEPRGRGRLAHRLGVVVEGHAGPLLDARARMEYRRRADELRNDLTEAERFNDVGRAATLRNELEQLVHELKRAYGRGGRTRFAAAGSERARVNVRNNVSTTLTILKRVNPALWRHLQSAVRTGTFCSYQPERPLPWVF